MIINYNVSGSDRKQLVAAIAEHLSLIHISEPTRRS